ncbi:MAG: serine protein kinase PrkA, partial [Patescibacteria group bacterium]
MNDKLDGLFQKITERNCVPPLSFVRLANKVAASPDLILRNIFQLFYDMFFYYLGEGTNPHSDDPESSRFIIYDSSRLFENGTTPPFFADNLFVNELARHVAGFRKGRMQNQIFIFEGPYGGGKSTLLNRLLAMFEAYTKTEAGATYETVWRIKREMAERAITRTGSDSYLVSQLKALIPNSYEFSDENKKGCHPVDEYLEVPCPNHDSPILLIPKEHRAEFLDELIEHEGFKKKLFEQRQYEWVFKDSPCTICQSLYYALLDILGSPSEVFQMLFAKKCNFDRRMGIGIGVFNPGDQIPKVQVMSNDLLQKKLNALLGDSSRVKYLHSRHANTNGGIYALMDIKGCNKERMANLHGLISDGSHRIEEQLEERINSLYLAVTNPEDRENIADAPSFSDRITYIRVPYIRDYEVEVKVWEKVFGEEIRKIFLPGVLEAFAKVIISSRLKGSKVIFDWISSRTRYAHICDWDFLLLKMELYAGKIPKWLTDEDRKKFSPKVRRKFLSESESLREGGSGITGRDSIGLFGEFYSAHLAIRSGTGRLVTIGMVRDFFEKKFPGRQNSPIPENFLGLLISMYNYLTLQEIKEAFGSSNEEHISRKILNYLTAVNFELGTKAKCYFTKEDLEISDGMYGDVERVILGKTAGRGRILEFRKET